MKPENKKAFLSILLACSLMLATGFGSLADNSKSKIQEVKTVNCGVTVMPLTETVEQVSEVAEKTDKKAEKKKAKKEAKKAAKKAAKKKNKKVVKVAKAAKSTNASNKYAARRNKAVSAKAKEVKILAAIIYCEAGNQPRKGKVAVGAVVVNRMADKRFPNTIREVVYQRGQFTPAMTGWLDRVIAEDNIPKECYKAAKAALEGENPVVTLNTGIGGLDGDDIEEFANSLTKQKDLIAEATELILRHGKEEI